MRAAPRGAAFLLESHRNEGKSCGSSHKLASSVSCLVVAGVIQLVECQLPKLDVAGSSPVARSHVNANDLRNRH